MKAVVITVLRQEIEVPDEFDKQDVYNFLAAHQSFKDAFEGVSDPTQTIRITDVVVVDETVTELGEETYDA